MSKTLPDEPSLSDAISIHYEKFFAKFKEIDTLPLQEWRTMHILAYICSRYEAYYGLRYTFKFNNPAPTKSYEMHIVRRLSNMLSSDPQILKDYLDWIFKHKIVEKKKRITSLAYFAHTDMVNDYKFKFLFTKKQLTRTDTLPDNVVSICNANGINIKTYGELAFIKQMPEKNALFDALKAVGFQSDILDRIA